MALTKEQLIQQSKDLVAQSGQMLAQTKSEGSKPFTGSAFDTSINVDTLGTGTKPVIPPQVPTTPIDYGAITGSLNAQTPPTEAPAMPKTPLETAQAQTKSFTDRISELYGTITGKSAFEEEKLKSADIVKQEKDVQELTNQLNQIQTEAKQIQVGAPSELAKQGISQGAITGLTNEQLKENALKALTISSQLEAKRGNLNLAYSQIDRAVKLKYEPMEKELEAKEKQLALLDKYTLTPLETRRKEELQLKLDKQKEKLSEEKTRKNAFEKSIADAISNGMSNAEILNVRALYDAGNEDAARLAMAKYTKGTLESTDVAMQRLQLAIEKAQQGPKRTQEEELKSDIASMGKVLESYSGTDGYIDPKEYARMKRAWVKEGNKSKSFDESFSIYRNPSDTYQVD